MKQAPVGYMYLIINLPYYAICLSFNKIEFRNYQITANHIRKSLNSLIMGAAIFSPKNSLKIVRFNGALRHTAEA